MTRQVYWTEFRLAELRRLYDDGLTMVAIGECFGRTKSSIIATLSRHYPERDLRPKLKAGQTAPLLENDRMAVLQFVYDGYDTMADVARAMGVDRLRIDHHIMWLRRQEYIHVIGKEQRGQQANQSQVWDVTPAGEELAKRALAEGWEYVPPKLQQRRTVFVQRRDPCVRCGVRGDIGCAHQPRDEGALLAA